MTRVNVIDPVELTDQHLLAEYRELPRIFALARPLRPRERPERYVLGRGHVKWFYPLTGWLARRQSALIAECIARGFDITHRAAPLPIVGLDGDWSPDLDDRHTNLTRLRDKLAARPTFYRYRGKPVGPGFY